jgi:uncharacterized protein (DUF1697 family)
MRKRQTTVVIGAGVHVALLRGINVGGKHKLKMAELVGLFEAMGCAEVRTYIQSGNVVFRAGAQVARTVAADLAQALERDHGYSVPVVTRTAAELAAVVAERPFLGGDVDPKHLHVAFLAKRPTAAAVARLDPGRSPPDSFVVSGREVFLCCPNGMARTRLTNAYLDATLGTVSTVRNWRTVLTLAEMSGERSAGGRPRPTGRGDS